MIEWVLDFGEVIEVLEVLQAFEALETCVLFLFSLLTFLSRWFAAFLFCLAAARKIVLSFSKPHLIPIIDTNIPRV